ncbi:hypothetical protein DL89DRAFT_169693 [Linderina pennispora]|uniref:Uncharacterized protein n=1 Tax=Linderina pennispora TaxID=61395 RepID=A0A1Y1W6A0_9FUNG|nr:uncharacterized protein DL89DRAFT_169693 [Linderina pennispora]ORX69031.1 hypothetical protein DL89DRAFT_169693 [Linderina pennispora]
MPTSDNAGGRGHGLTTEASSAYSSASFSEFAWYPFACERSLRYSERKSSSDCLLSQRGAGHCRRCACCQRRLNTQRCARRLLQTDYRADPVLERQLLVADLLRNAQPASRAQLSPPSACRARYSTLAAAALHTRNRHQAPCAGPRAPCASRRWLR